LKIVPGAFRALVGDVHEIGRVTVVLLLLSLIGSQMHGTLVRSLHVGARELRAEILAIVADIPSGSGLALVQEREWSEIVESYLVLRCLR
jgi:hypothetical protein